MLTFPDSFFEPEVREGFYIGRMMKRLWAAQLITLSEIDAVCRRHGIRWFADNGTLLGLVRHGGYIPWDDDLDISMLREDYNRFNEVAAEELPQGYVVRNVYTDCEHNDLTTRVLNSDTIRLDGEFLTTNGGFPYCAGIDIFPLDDLASDEAGEEERIRRVNDVCRLGELLLDSPDVKETKLLYQRVERENHITIDRRDAINSLNRLLDALYSMHTGSGSEYVALMHYWTQPRRGHRYKRDMFKETLMLPFENTRLPAPCCFEDVLRVEYGDFMRVVRKWDMHTFPIYAPQEALLEQAAGKNPLKYDFKGQLKGTHPNMPREDAAESINRITVDDPLLGFDPYGGRRAQADPAAMSDRTGELVLEPALQPTPRDEWNGKLAIAMEEQILSPMLIYAHRVLLHDEKLREIYLDVLRTAAPEVPWEEKLEAAEEQRTADAEPGRGDDARRMILYYTGYSMLCSHGRAMVDKAARSLEILRSEEESIRFVWVPQNLLAGEEDNNRRLYERDPEVYGAWVKLLGDYERYISPDLEGEILRCDAYYGDQGYPAHRCRELGKPVMIENVEI